MTTVLVEVDVLCTKWKRELYLRNCKHLGSTCIYEPEDEVGRNSVLSTFMKEKID